MRLSAQPLFRGRCLARTQPAEVIATLENTNATPVLGTLVLDLDTPPRGIHTARTLTVAVPATVGVAVRVALVPSAMEAPLTGGERVTARAPGAAAVRPGRQTAVRHASAS